MIQATPSVKRHLHDAWRTGKTTPRFEALDRAAKRMRPTGRERIITHDGGNKVIAKSVQRAAVMYRAQARPLADVLRRMDAMQAARLIHDWAKARLSYRIDPLGKQIIQSPAAFVKRGYGDCKAFSILITSALAEAGHPAWLRFTGKTPDGPYTHVYAMTRTDWRPVAVDPVWHRFDSEHPHQKESNMEIQEISGIGKSRGGKSAPAKKKIDLATATEAQLSLELERQRMAIKRQIALKLGDRTLAGKFALRARQATELRDAAKNPDAVDRVVTEIANGLTGIGAAKRQKARKDKEKPEGRLKSLGEKIKKAGQTALKVATAPARMGAKAAIEVAIPKAALGFKYLFITDPKVVSKLPAAIADKRKKQVEIMDFIVENIGMKRDHFLQIVRNGILKKTSMEPEKLLQQELAGKVSGIGLIEDVFKAVQDLINLIKKLTGKAGPKVSKEDIPATQDAKAGSASAIDLGNDIKRQRGDMLDAAQENNSSSTMPPRRSIC